MQPSSLPQWQVTWDAALVIQSSLTRGVVEAMGETRQTAGAGKRDRGGGRGTGWLAWLLVALLGVGLLLFVGALIVGVVSVNVGDESGEDVRAGQTDAEIRAAVQAGLRRDARLPVDSASAIVVNVEEGAVTLAGAVASFGQKVAAGDIVRHTAGAVLVDNQLQVRPAGPVSDQELRRLIVSGLGLFDATRRADLTVGVEDGVVTLGGAVDSLVAKRRAYQLATGIAGVREVRDTIAVAPRVSRTDQEITTDVRASFHASPVLRDQTLDVRAEGGTIILSGTVRDLTSLELAEEIAIYTHGARGLDNRLRVRR